jgi:hypothetical protein
VLTTLALVAVAIPVARALLALRRHDTPGPPTLQAS